MQSPLRRRFWCRPIYIGATVLLPKGYDQHPGVLYPSVYIQGHYSLAAPFNFSTQFKPDDKSWAPEREKAIAGYLNVAEPHAGGPQLPFRAGIVKDARKAFARSPILAITLHWSDVGVPIYWANR